MLAMLANSAQHGLEFIRFWGGPGIDPSSISLQVNEFVQKRTWLFVDARCIQLGHTRHMLQLLKKPIPIPKTASGTQLRALGGGDAQEQISSGMKRMQCWVSLAIEVIQTEFPDAEFLQCFNMFALSMPQQCGERRRVVDDARFVLHARRIA